MAAPMTTGIPPKPHHDPDAQKGCLYILAIIIVAVVVISWIW